MKCKKCKHDLFKIEYNLECDGCEHNGADNDGQYIYNDKEIEQLGLTRDQVEIDMFIEKFERICPL